MADRSSARHSQPTRTPQPLVHKIVHLRWKQRLGPGSVALGFVLVAAASALFGGPGAAATSSVVLTPPPLDWSTCQTNGSGTVCHGKQGFSHTGGFDGTCPQGFDILDNANDQETGGTGTTTATASWSSGCYMTSFRLTTR